MGLIYRDILSERVGATYREGDFISTIAEPNTKIAVLKGLPVTNPARPDFDFLTIERVGARSGQYAYYLRKYTVTIYKREDQVIELAK